MTALMRTLRYAALPLAVTTHATSPLTTFTSAGRNFRAASCHDGGAGSARQQFRCDRGGWPPADEQLEQHSTLPLGLLATSTAALDAPSHARGQEPGILPRCPHPAAVHPARDVVPLAGSAVGPPVGSTVTGTNYFAPGQTYSQLVHALHHKASLLHPSFAKSPVNFFELIKRFLPFKVAPHQAARLSNDADRLRRWVMAAGVPKHCVGVPSGRLSLGCAVQRAAAAAAAPGSPPPDAPSALLSPHGHGTDLGQPRSAVGASHPGARSFAAERLARKSPAGGRA